MKPKRGKDVENGLAETLAHKPRGNNEIKEK